MSKQQSIKADAIEPVAHEKEAEAFLLRIGNLQREVERLNADMNDEISLIRKRYEQKAIKLNDEIQEKFSRLHVWAEANKATLLKGKSKTAKLATGELSWRTPPPSVSVRKEDEVVVALKAAGMSDFVRIKETVNKDAILSSDENKARASSIKGISIKQTEQFVAKPHTSEIERVETVDVSTRKEAA